MRPNDIWTKMKACEYCSQEAVSVCNVAETNFKGCGKPFCKDHGLFQPIKRFELGLITTFVLQDEYENHRKTLAVQHKVPQNEFRICKECLKKPDLSRIQQRRRALALSLTFFILAFLTLLVLLKTPQKATDDGLSFVSFQLKGEHLVKSAQFQLKDHIQWHRYRNPNCRQIKILDHRDVDSSDSLFSGTLICSCSQFQRPSRSSIVNGTETSFQPCRTAPCPPNGTNYIVRSGVCQPQVVYYLPDNATYETSYFASGKQIICPYLTRYRPEYGACVVSVCDFFGFYYLSRPDFGCQRCPLFTSRDRTSLFCNFGEMTVEEATLEYRSPTSRESNDCPAKGPVFDFVHGYRPRVVDQFGYYWCPEFEAESLTKVDRICEWYEMTLQQLLGCTSPCESYLEKWDFALKKCVPGETECSQFGLILAASGECYWKISQN